MGDILEDRTRPPGDAFLNHPATEWREVIAYRQRRLQLV